MKELRLPCGKVAFVDDEDWPQVSRLSWYDRSGGYPAARHKKSEGGDGRIVQLHRFLMKPPPGMVVDHIDGNTLNNQRANLQVTTTSRNSMKGKRALRGGIFHRVQPWEAWEARMRVDGRIVRLGSYGSEGEARAVLAAARDLVWSSPRFNPSGVKLSPD